MLENRFSHPRSGSCLPAVIVGLCTGLAMTAGPIRAQLITPGAQLEEVHSASLFFEGPTWSPRIASLLFTSLTAPGQILKLEPPAGVQTWLSNTQGINGTFLSNDGRLLCAQGDARRIIAIQIGLTGPGELEILASNPAWRMPNDLCQTPSGDIYFTTPFGVGQGGYVYRLAPDGSVTPAVTDLISPNGIIASLDGTTLYVGDSSTKRWHSYPVLPGGDVGTGSVFFDPVTANQNDPDGMDIDEQGNLYFCGRGGVWIVSPQGQQLAMIPVPQFPTNVQFGGVDGRSLYITCDGKLYRLAMEVRGGLWRNVPPDNQPPLPEAGPDQTISSRVPTTLLAGNVTDDGQPDPPGAITIEWLKLAGPGSVTFDDPTSAETNATFSTPGTYVLRLHAFDGIRSATDEATITVVKPGDSDDDGDVDSADMGRFIDCRSGPFAGAPDEDCWWSDIDADGDLDQSDFGLIQRCLSGSGVPSDPTCAN